MLTGLPTVLGWDYHVKQRGNDAREVEARKNDIRAMYQATDVARSSAPAPLPRRVRLRRRLERKVYLSA